jgi:pyridoxine 4-dehydrogenase
MARDRIETAAGKIFSLGGDHPITRLGLGTNRLTGAGVWGEPADREAAVAVLRRAVRLGVDFIDTADSYGPFVSEELIAQSLHPYDGVTIATKGGLVRTGPDQWHPVGRPEYLRQCVEMSLRRLKLERIDLYQLHRIDPNVPTAEQIGVLEEMRSEGKIKHIGLSKVTVAEIIEAQRTAPVVSVQNPYNLLNREFEDVLGYCEQEGLGFIPWFPLDTGRLAGRDGPLAALARNAGLTPVQLALAWLLRRSPVLLPIPGTASLAHLEENLASARVELTDEQYAALSSPRDAADLDLASRARWPADDTRTSRRLTPRSSRAVCPHRPAPRRDPAAPPRRRAAAAAAAADRPERPGAPGRP